jgi:hypothetical protein
VSPTFGTPIYAQWLCSLIAALLACVQVPKQRFCSWMTNLFVAMSTLWILLNPQAV